MLFLPGLSQFLQANFAIVSHVWPVSYSLHYFQLIIHKSRRLTYSVGEVSLNIQKICSQIKSFNAGYFYHLLF